MTSTIEEYLSEGCGRCKLGGTPDCKVHTWSQELELLRNIVLETSLTEEIKWGVPCYTYKKKNVVMISAFKNFCCLTFFKGSLLSNTQKLLEKQGENSHVTRIIKFTNTTKIKKNEIIIKALIFEAIEIEKSGQQVIVKKNSDPIPEELENILATDGELKNAFFALTPGKQRGYILYFSQPKQAKTRISRIEKCTPKILNGEGLHDKYKAKRK
ncbi:YdeI/OmpD-associated family protein [Tenacibaculum sp. IB213877]|uniref:YdeI/OmpD-associated family protein n=1 Tax=Tenacibaculum sp. IB213877 TaxID=3097351 RepID=UPI002A5A57BC|nr:DUF1801 domain-containing protein [Tenacibaculum sp. IB213877]MDY0779766.1 DUF1801 domain-containing protein [Tenacibaculum sp. IB213877]